MIFGVAGCGPDGYPTLGGLGRTASHHSPAMSRPCRRYGPPRTLGLAQRTLDLLLRMLGPRHVDTIQRPFRYVKRTRTASPGIRDGQFRTPERRTGTGRNEASKTYWDGFSAPRPPRVRAVARATARTTAARCRSRSSASRPRTGPCARGTPGWRPRRSTCRCGRSRCR